MICGRLADFHESVMSDDSFFNGEALAPEAVGYQMANCRRIVDDQDALALACQPRREQRAQAAGEFFGGYRFDQIVVGPGVEALFQILGLAERRADHDRDLRLGGVALDAAAQLESVELRHFYVGQEHVWTA